MTAATICRPRAFVGHHRCQADGPFTSPLTRGHSGTAHGHSRGEVSLYTQASSSRTFCAWNALRDTWSEAHAPCPSIIPLHLFSAQCSGGGPQGLRGRAEASLAWLITQLEAQPRVERQLRKCNAGTWLRSEDTQRQVVRSRRIKGIKMGPVRWLSRQRGLPHKPGNMSLSSRTHIKVERENRAQKPVLCLHTHSMVHAASNTPHTHIHTV